MKRWLLLLVLAPVLIWSAYWGAAAFGMKHSLTTALSGQGFYGLSATAQASHGRGFPSQFLFDVTDMELHQAGMFSASIPSIQIEASAYTPHLINLELGDPQRVSTAFGETVIEADLFQIGIFLRPHLSVPLDRAGLRLESANLTAPDYGKLLSVERLNMGFFESPESQSGQAEGLYRLNVEGAGIDVSELLSDFPEEYHNISNIRTDIGLIYSNLWDRSVLHTGVPLLRNVIIPEFELIWGPSEISLTGQVSVSGQGTLTGDIVLDISAWRGFLMGAVQAEIVDPDLAALILQLMDGQDENDTINLPLRIENNLVSFGVFTLGFLPIP